MKLGGSTLSCAAGRVDAIMTRRVDRLVVGPGGARCARSGMGQPVLGLVAVVRAHRHAGAPIRSAGLTRVVSQGRDMLGAGLEEVVHDPRRGALDSGAQITAPRARHKPARRSCAPALGIRLRGASSVHVDRRVGQ